MRRTGLQFAAMYFLLAIQTVRADAPEDFVARFDRMDQRINKGQGYCASLNTSGELAWAEAYILQGYIEMYRATKDRAYLDSLVEHFDKVLASRDDVRKVKDYYRKVPMAGWGSNEYSRQRWHVWAVHTGVICLGPAEFVRTVYGISKLRREYGDKGDEYLTRVKEAVAANDPDWRDGPGKDEGHYVDASLGVGPLPLNQQNALGSIIVELYRITRDHAYKERAMKLAVYFKRRLHLTDDGAYEWSYQPREDTSSNGSEDISHAAINIDFALRCRWAHIVFKQKEMLAFTRTWTTKIRRGPGEWANTVAGTGGTNTHIPSALGRWLDLCQFDRSIIADARRAFAKVDEDKATAANMLGIAKLARWERRIRTGIPDDQE